MRNLNPDQLKMFMSPREISHYVDGYGDFPGDSPRTGLPHEDMKRLDQGYAYVKEDALTRGMGEHVAAEGVHKPVQLYHGAEGPTDKRVWDGHHRVYAQSQADPDRLMPVVHRDQGETKSGRSYVNNIEFPPGGDLLPYSAGRKV